MTRKAQGRAREQLFSKDKPAHKMLRRIKYGERGRTVYDRLEKTNSSQGD